MEKSNYTERPLALERHRNGVHIFRWDIVEVQKEDMDGNTHTEYECYEVWVTNGSSDRTTEAAIDALWGNGVEQKLTNDYLAAKEGIFVGEKAERALQAYRTFLEDRISLKEEIAAAYEEEPESSDED